MASGGKGKGGGAPAKAGCALGGSDKGKGSGGCAPGGHGKGFWFASDDGRWLCPSRSRSDEAEMLAWANRCCPDMHGSAQLAMWKLKILLGANIAFMSSKKAAYNSKEFKRVATQVPELAVNHKHWIGCAIRIRRRP